MGRLDFSSPDFGQNLVAILRSDFERANLLRFAIKEWSLENVVALLCIADFRGQPTRFKVETFYDVFLDGWDLHDSPAPMAINLGRGAGRKASDKIKIAVDFLRNGSTKIVNQLATPPMTTLDDLIGPLCSNLNDTMSRFNLERGAIQQTRFKGTIFAHNVHQKRTVAATAKLSPTQAPAILSLKAGGFDTRSMGLDVL